ncbi:MAG: RNA polymerase sigma factor region1.1 domain-containing protein, partial [Pseudomonadota bacterium]
MSKTNKAAKDESDRPVLDLNLASVRKMIDAAKKKGYVTYDALNAALPTDEYTSEQIEDIMAKLSDMGINVTDTEEEEEEAANDDKAATGSAVAKKETSATVTTNTKADSDRTDDPVRMYLREMGQVELLSREGEIAIAKRIEAGRESMIRALCESSLTFEAITVWREELEEGRVLLRDIIDLDATYDGGPESKPDMTKPEVAEAIQREQEAKAAEGIDEDDMDEGDLSLSAKEAELREGVMVTFQDIADDFKKLRRLQDIQIEQHLGGEDLSESQRKRLRKLQKDIVERVRSVRLHNHRIEALVEQLYSINRSLMALEGKLVRLADSYGVNRQEFLREYLGNELDPEWL